MSSLPIRCWASTGSISVEPRTRLHGAGLGTEAPSKKPPEGGFFAGKRRLLRGGSGGLAGGLHRRRSTRTHRARCPTHRIRCCTHRTRCAFRRCRRGFRSRCGSRRRLGRRRRRRCRFFLLATSRKRNGRGQRNHQKCCSHTCPRLNDFPITGNCGEPARTEPHRAKTAQNSSDNAGPCEIIGSLGNFPYVDSLTPLHPARSVAKAHQRVNQPASCHCCSRSRASSLSFAISRGARWRRSARRRISRASRPPAR